MRKEHKSPKGGLTAAGRAYFKRKTGANLKPPAPNPKTKKDKARKRSYYARHNAQGQPTTKLSAKYWSHKVKW